MSRASVELQRGELIRVLPPKKGHPAIERQLFHLLHAQYGDRYFVDKEFTCRPLPEYEVLTADVAMATSTPESHGRTRKPGESIPLNAFGGGLTAFSDIFMVQGQ